MGPFWPNLFHPFDLLFDHFHTNKFDQEPRLASNKRPAAAAVGRQDEKQRAHFRVSRSARFAGGPRVVHHWGAELEFVVSELLEIFLANL